jgi:hypothetical protein
VSIARGPGTISVSTSDGIRARPIVGKEDDTSDQMKLRLSDRVFEDDEFRAANSEDHDEGKFKALLVVESGKGDTLIFSRTLSGRFQP